MPAVSSDGMQTKTGELGLLTMFSAPPAPQAPGLLRRTGGRTAALSTQQSSLTLVFREEEPSSEGVSDRRAWAICVTSSIQQDVASERVNVLLEERCRLPA